MTRPCHPYWDEDRRSASMDAIIAMLDAQAASLFKQAAELAAAAHTLRQIGSRRGCGCEGGQSWEQK